MARKPPAPPSPELLAKAAEVHRRLCEAYHCPIPYFHSLDPLSELISSSLSHRTRNADSGRAFKTLRATFPTWRDVMNAPTGEVEAAIAACTWPELKAPRVQHILRKIEAERGELSLDFLAALDVPAARAWLERCRASARRPARPCCRSACCARPPCRSIRTTTAWPSGWS